MAPGATITIPGETARVSSPSESTSASNLPYRRSNASLSTIFASTSTPPTSRPISPTGDTSLGSTLRDGVVSPNAPMGASPLALQESQPDDPRNLIMRSFVPHIAIHVSPDVEDIAKQKGINGGFLELLRPFGETIQGRVTVRDSIGASRSWDDYGVRFVGLGDGLGNPRAAEQDFMERGAQSVYGNPNDESAVDHAVIRAQKAALRVGGDIGQIEDLVEQHLAYAEMISGSAAPDYLNFKNFVQASSTASPFHSLYLRRLLSGLPLSPHETFAHPVACIIAISSRNPSPIESLRQLYDSTTRGDRRMPMWVNGEYLRYYVLIHDEERDDITKSTALFEQMKRHFGLHCHLLRIRSSFCVPTDDDSIQLPSCQWISAAEELIEIRRRQAYDEAEDSPPCIFESDCSAIRTFVREMVTQSIIPFMERCAATWNDQVASRRRGISGRFMSLSKKWTGFGSSRSAASSGLGSSGSNSNYDALQGFYRPDTPEATMRKLADYAFMLRDWKLAQSIYDIIRADFNHDKAWKYQAGANEMGALSTLLTGQSLTSKSRSEVVDQLLETASYSYITRCSAPYSALRCLALGAELLKLRGGSSAANAARWETRILELRILGPVGHALFTERIGAFHAMCSTTPTERWTARTRKAAFWNVLAADAWLKLDKTSQADKCLKNASTTYGEESGKNGAVEFTAIQDFIEDLHLAIRASSLDLRNHDGVADLNESRPATVEVEKENLNTRSHRKSLMGAGMSPFVSLDGGPLSPVRTKEGDSPRRDDDFQEEAPMG
ncbi:MAG: hypothetical protein M4579_004016 [Chaenotheca gracillima]|nr:MAG: hypothetical protein M4579_004016 [Chaenotheca gracillima]